MTPMLSQVYGVRRPSNPGARAVTPEPLFPRSYGPRKFRRKLRALLRAGSL